jgi:hypothetical protein
MTEDAESALKYRRIAAELRQLSEKFKYDHRRQNQLLALAEGFERFAARLSRKQLWAGGSRLTQCAYPKPR